jgi:hypothetical protein
MSLGDGGTVPLELSASDAVSLDVFVDYLDVDGEMLGSATIGADRQASMTSGTNVRTALPQG